MIRPPSPLSFPRRREAVSLRRSTRSTSGRVGLSARMLLIASLAISAACTSDTVSDPRQSLPTPDTAPVSEGLGAPAPPPGLEPYPSADLPGLPGDPGPIAPTDMGAELPDADSSRTNGDPAAADAGRMVVTGAHDGLPADMLSAAEAEKAAEAALGALADVVGAATDRDSLSVADVSTLADRPNYRVMYTQRAATKASVGRAAEVAVYRYDTNESVLRQIDLSTGVVMEVTLPAGYAPPLLPREIQEAARVARLDSDVRAALEAAGMDADNSGANGLLTGTPFEPDHQCAAHRCVRLFFHDERNPVPTFSVIVDLSAFEVVEVTPMSSSRGPANGYGFPPVTRAMFTLELAETGLEPDQTGRFVAAAHSPQGAL
jgi:hypothetical protein